MVGGGWWLVDGVVWQAGGEWWNSNTLILKYQISGKIYHLWGKRFMAQHLNLRSGLVLAAVHHKHSGTEGATESLRVGAGLIWTKYTEFALKEVTAPCPVVW